MTETQGYGGASEAAIQSHYDVGNDFMRLWLDDSLTYSCALWEPGDTLEAAQHRKLDHLLDGARIAAGSRLLDVGCGWGSLLDRALDREVASGVGLTLSAAQHDHLTARGDPRLEILLRGWAEYEPSAPFDGIVSIGAFEHFARLGLTEEERLASYGDFFRRCHGWLAPGGRIALQTIAKGSVPVNRQGLKDLLLIVKQMFPESELPLPSEVVRASESHFELERIRNDRLDYARTCQAWLDRLDAHWDEALELAGTEVAERYREYLAACVRQFEDGHAVLLRAVLRRLDQPAGASSIARRFRKEEP